MAGKKTDKDDGTGGAVTKRRGTSQSGRKRSANAVGPVLLAGIDVGSTAVRMNIAEFTPDNSLRVVEELTHPVSTGAETFGHGFILPETMHFISHILDNYLRLLDDYGVKHRRAVASSAVREAGNREFLVDRIRHNTGLELEILDAVEESRLAYQALLPWLKQYSGNYSMALNLGGGSTELMVLRGEDLQLGGAKRLGTSRLFHGTGRWSSQAKLEILQATAANIVNSTRESYQEYSISQFFLINRILYRALRNIPAAERHDSDFSVRADALVELLRKTYGLGSLEIGRIFNMGLAEVELLLPAMMILENFVVTSEVEEVTFTNTEMLTGLLIEMSTAVQGGNPLMSFRRQMIRSARAVGEKYFYDRTHARVVTEFSLCLFDALKGMLDLGDQERLLLELSAILHDIGMYVSEHRHHRHGAYLIQWSDIVGLKEADRHLTSQIAFFHRKELPTPEHPGFGVLGRDDRIRVSKLAGILRLADVLDRGHRQTVKSLRVELSGDKLFLFLETSDDLGIILDALPKKADLLKQVTGLEIVLRREIPKI